MTTLSYMYMAECQFKSVRWNGVPRKGSVSYGLGADFSLPHCLVREKGIEKQRETICSWHERTVGRNLVVYRHGTTFRQSVQRYRCRLYFSLFFSHFDIKAGKSPEDIVGKEAFHSCPLSCPCQIVDRYCVDLIAFKPILHIKHFPLKI